MRRFTLKPKTFFKLFVAAAAFALGLFAAGLWPRRVASPTPPPAAPAPSRATVSVRDTFADGAEDGEAVFEGRYENYVYGYSVHLPAGMVGAGSTPPAPQHGFGIDLDHPRSTVWRGVRGFPKSYLYVDGSYNSLEWERLDDAVNAHLSYKREDGVAVRVLSKTQTRLGDLRAVRVVARYEERGEQMVWDAVFAFGDGASPVYTLALSTPLSKYERDRPVLEEVRATWRLQPAE
ncbi:MAG: hypothetical protein LC795_09730 [Acidobacteria bacterium]|nr:hypothetical protein [Acidobacteriota bacterium]